MAQTEVVVPDDPVSLSHKPGPRLLRNIGLLAGSQVTTWTITLLWTLIVPRLLGPSQMGMMTTAISTTAIVGTLVAMGVTVLLVKEVARHTDRTPQMVGAALIMEALLYLPAVALIVLFMTLARFGFQQNVVLVLAAIGMLPMVLRGPFEASLKGIERMEYPALSGVIAKVANSAGGLVLVLLGLGVIPLTILSGVVETLLLLLNARWFHKYFRVDWRASRAAIARLFAASLPYGTTYLVGSVYSYVDAVMLAIITAPTIVGWYGVSNRVIGTLTFLPVIVSTALLPRLSALFKGEPANVHSAARPVFELILALSLPITLGTMLIARPVVGMLYGSSFAPAGTVIAVAALSLPFTYFNILAWQVLVACNKQWLWARVMLVTTVVNIVLNGVLILWFQANKGNGAIGSATALLSTEAIMTIIGLWLLRGLLTRSSWGRLLRSLAATALMAGAVWWASRFGLGAEIAVGCIVFAVAALALRVVQASELTALVSMIRRHEPEPVSA